MKIYLDYNLFAYLHEGNFPSLRTKIDALSNRHKFPYSPAHMEEIATALMNPSAIKLDERVRLAGEKIINVSQITSNTELFPADIGPMTEKEEHPLDCFVRVLRHYDRNPVVEQWENERLTQYKEGDPDGDIANEMSNLPDDFLLDTDHGQSLLGKLHFDVILPLICKARGIKGFSWPEMSGQFSVVERAIEIAMNFLEEIRYRPEHIKKSRSRMHDVTHSIYATGCEFLVTHDKRFHHKVKAVYRYFDIPTKVITLDEFIATDFD